MWDGEEAKRQRGSGRGSHCLLEMGYGEEKQIARVVNVGAKSLSKHKMSSSLDWK